MNKYTATTVLLLLIATVYWSYWSLVPTYTEDVDASGITFSTDRALKHVKEIAQKPHAVGFPAHTEVRRYIVAQLQNLGLEPVLQQGYSAGDWGNLSKATNILAKIKGTGDGKALLVSSHYDSSPHSALGASDAGSGVATILEGIRALLESGTPPKNDIIILITDAEELGLNGADLFVNQHPWARDVGLVLNFEARGSGGPSYMLIETNRGNGRLIEEFTKAHPKYPVANSLAYSIYKMLPNDTDLTVFREDGDIEGLNFAFIDDHFDYHTALDTYERLDRNTLAHQGSYLMPLLHHFGNVDLGNLKSLNDYVYFNMPFFGLVSYPFEWIWPMFYVALLLFALLLVSGFRKKELHLLEIGKGFVPLLLSVVINGVIGWYGWSILKGIYPQYQDMLHGFTYNGHTYILAFALCSLGICLWVYHVFRKITAPNLLIAPLVLWMLICWGVSSYLEGAAFFIVPLLSLLAGLLVVINQKEPRPFVLLLLAVPPILMLAPFVKAFPVGLGLKLMVAATVMTTLIFLVVLPLLSFLRRKNRLALLCLLMTFGFLVAAHLDSGFNEQNAKPTSLLYVLDGDDNSAKWATYEKRVSDWTSQYLGEDRTVPEKLGKTTLSSKYSSGFTFVAPAPIKPVAMPKTMITLDTILGDRRTLEICISPQRPVNRLEIFTNPVPILEAKANRIPLSKYYLEQRKGGRLLTHYITGNEDTELLLSIPKDAALELILYEASNDLLDNTLFTIPPRPKENIPMPFVLNDAILTVKTLRFE